MKTNCIIIDDHTLFNDGLAMILKESVNFQVIEQIYDSRQAYHKCLCMLPDLVLVDFNMPHINGIEVVKQLKSLQKTPKIIIISMYAERKEIKRFEEMGVDGFVSKTIAGNSLLTILRNIMDGKTHFDLKPTTRSPVGDTFTLKYKLTKREIQILKLLKKEYTTEQMAQSLGLSYYTVETHRKNINQKLKFDTKKEYYDFLEEF